MTLNLTTPRGPPPVEECGYHGIPLELAPDEPVLICPLCEAEDAFEAAQLERLAQLKDEGKLRRR